MMADTMMVGRILGVNALAAMGASTSLANLIIGFASGIAMGSSIMIAQYYGAKDEEACDMHALACVRFCILSHNCHDDCGITNQTSKFKATTDTRQYY